MPSTIQYRPNIIDLLITNERINSYGAVFKPSNDIELVGVYLWNAHVCGAIYPIISAAEIALRNAIDQALASSSLGRFWWSGSKLQYNSFMPGLAAPFEVQALKNNFASATQAFLKDRKNRYDVAKSVPPTHAGVVAKTEFSTWEFILNHEFMGNNKIWPARLGKAFCGPWPSTHASTVLTHAKDLVSTIRDFRNRVFHHEPAWKRFGVHTEADAILHLQEKISKIETLLTLIHPEKTRLLTRSGLLPAARRACSSDEIRRFQHLATTKNIKSVSRLADLVDACSRNNQVVRAKVFKGNQQEFLITPA